ncbi:HhH-GPD-type base excision DNA repair protein [Gulosibacter sediminis]|uniref:HhH-GPD-type base excision DNA repair protein n=1 Tax=Gulosibacter sediminis TaxID=1729695 RepID=UPI0024AD6AD1|nr:HhH-GPD-type base excision DNA repair protein [Gulosibacter sediminis]
MTTVYLSTDPKADELLAHDRFALLVGMLLDQQVPMETAFAGPQKLVERLDEFSPGAVAAIDEDALLAAFKQTPAVHRFPGSMATRVQALARAIADDYDGDTAAIWQRDGKSGNAPSGAEILRRLKALPGFGEQKAKIFLALLGKQFGLEADGWREAAGDYGPAGAFRSIADVVDDESLQRVRETKKALKAAAKNGQS